MAQPAARGSPPPGIVRSCGSVASSRVVGRGVGGGGPVDGLVELSVEAELKLRELLLQLRELVAVAAEDTKGRGESFGVVMV